SATGALTAILHKGQTISSHPIVADASECWLNVTWGSQPVQTGFLRCEDIQEHAPEVSSVPTATATRQPDQIDQLMTLAGIDRYVQSIAGESSLRFLSNTQRLDENDGRVRQVFERALQPETFYSLLRAGCPPSSSAERIRWLMSHLNQPKVRRVTELVTQANSVQSRRELIPD